MIQADVDVLIIGGGPAGLAAATELKRIGIKEVLILEREREFGGIPRHCHHTGFGWFDLRKILSGPSYAKKRTDLLIKSKAEFQLDTSVVNWIDHLTVKAISPLGHYTISAKAILLATGCRERSRFARLIPGTRPQGIFTTGSLQQLTYFNHQKVGSKAIVVGAEHVSFSAIHTLLKSKTQVSALVTEHPHHQTYSLFSFLTAGIHRVPIFTHTRLTQVFGSKQVEAVELTHLSTGQTKTVSCDTVVFTGDWIPAHELARLGHIEIDEGTLGPACDFEYKTSKHGVFATGNLLHGAEMADVAAIEGQDAAHCIYRFLKNGDWDFTSFTQVKCQDPLQWIFPNRISLNSLLEKKSKKFIFRSKHFLNHARVKVFQNENEIYSQYFKKLIPNRPFQLDAKWCSKIEKNSGPIQITAIDFEFDLKSKPQIL